MAVDCEALLRSGRAAASAASFVAAPLFAMASVERVDAVRLRQAAHPEHLAPEEVLPGARTVLSWFLPFRPEVIAAARRARPEVAREWADAYTEGNQMVEGVGMALAECLLEAGHRATVRPPTADFDKAELMSRWSHKHVAVLAGLGQFGRNCQVITRAGCAGRLGSMLTDAELPEQSPSAAPTCEEICGERAPCRKNCPVGALPGVEGSIDRNACWARLLESAKTFSDLPGAQVCGICAVAACARL